MKIVAHLQSAAPGPPLTDAEIQPYASDMLEILGVADRAPDVMHVASGQPFRLRLWKLLASCWNDPGLDFLDALAHGVKLAFSAVTVL